MKTIKDGLKKVVKTPYDEKLEFLRKCANALQSLHVDSRAVIDYTELAKEDPNLRVPLELDRRGLAKMDGYLLRKNETTDTAYIREIFSNEICNLEVQREQYIRDLRNTENTERATNASEISAKSAKEANCISKWAIVISVIATTISLFGALYSGILTK